MSERYIYQHSAHMPSWAISYEVEPYNLHNKWVRVFLTVYSEEIENLGQASFEVSSKTPFGIAQRISNYLKGLGVTFDEEDFNQVEWEFSRYF